MSYFFSEDWNDWNKFEIWLVSVSELWIPLLAWQHRRYLFVVFECWMQFVNRLRLFHILLFSLFCFALSFTWSLLPDSLLLCFCTRFVYFCQFPDLLQFPIMFTHFRATPSSVLCQNALQNCLQAVLFVRLVIHLFQEQNEWRREKRLNFCSKQRLLGL